MSSQYINEDMLKQAGMILEDRSEDELEEGVIGDIAAKIADRVEDGTRDIVKGAAKDIVEGIFGPKEERLLKGATTTYAELLRISGLNVSDETVKEFLSKTLLKKVAANVENKRSKQIADQAPKASDFKVVR